MAKRTKPKTKPKTIADREKALAILRKARDRAERGWIKKGRESIHWMLGDCLEAGLYDCGYDKGTILYRPLQSRHRSLCPIEYGLAMGYVCRALPRETDPGTNSLRIKKIGKFEDQHIHSHTIYTVLANAVRLAMADLQERRAALRGGK